MSATRAALPRIFPRLKPRSNSASRRSKRPVSNPARISALGLDCAASEFFKDGAYVYSGEGKTRSIDEQVQYLAKLADSYPILSIEDGMAEQDWAGWKLLTEKLGAKRQLVGDDIFVTNTKRPQSRNQGRRRQFDSDQGQSDRHAERDAWPPSTWLSAQATPPSCRTVRAKPRISTIADLAVATNCGQIKTGSLSRSDRLAKYNQLIRIEEELGDQARYAGREAIKAI